MIRCDYRASTWHYAGELAPRTCARMLHTLITNAKSVAAFLVSMGWRVVEAVNREGQGIVRDLCELCSVSDIVTAKEGSARARNADVDPSDPRGLRLLSLARLPYKDPDYDHYDDEPRFLTEPLGTLKKNLEDLTKLEDDPDNPPSEQLAFFAIR